MLMLENWDRIYVCTYNNDNNHTKKKIEIKIRMPAGKERGKKKYGKIPAPERSIAQNFFLHHFEVLLIN